MYIFHYTVPSGPPINVRAHSVNPAGMRISWTRPKLLDCNGNILQYIIKVDDGDSDERSYTFNVSSVCIKTTCTEPQCFSHTYVVPENELVPHKEYSVKVAAVNINGTGPFSSGNVVMSGDDGKTQPLTVTVI